MNAGIIEKLWEESTKSSWPRPGKFTAGEYDYNLQKFAELIVKECIKSCGNHPDVENFGVLPIRAVIVTKSCENNIREHFGIKR